MEVKVFYGKCSPNPGWASRIPVRNQRQGKRIARPVAGQHCPLETPELLGAIWSLPQGSREPHVTKKHLKSGWYDRETGL